MLPLTPFGVLDAMFSIESQRFLRKYICFGPVAKIFLVMCYVLCFCKNNWRHCRKVESSLDHRRRILSRDLYVTPELIYMAISCEDGALLYYAVNISSDDGALSNEDGTLLYEVGAFYVKVFFI